MAYGISEYGGKKRIIWNRQATLAEIIQAAEKEFPEIGLEALEVLLTSRNPDVSLMLREKK